MEGIFFRTAVATAHAGTAAAHIAAVVVHAAVITARTVTVTAYTVPTLSRAGTVTTYMHPFGSTATGNEKIAKQFLLERAQHTLEST